MTDRVRPYLFYDVAVSICSTCYRKVEGKIVFEDGNVPLLKRCPEHGNESILIADDVDYYRRCREVFIKPPEMPRSFNTPVKWGCPYDCGLCADHQQHSCLSLIEICDYCNLQLPGVLRRKRPGATGIPLARQPSNACSTPSSATRASPTSSRSPAASPRCIPISFAMLDMAKARPIRHLMVNTNGVRIAQDEDFVDGSPPTCRISRSICSSIPSSATR